jgi:hypothetical protein
MRIKATKTRIDFHKSSSGNISYASFFNNLLLRSGFKQIVRAVLFLACVVLLLTRLSLAQDSKPSKIPDGEAQFTSEQLEQHYLVYKNPDVRYLRTLFDSYPNNSGGTEQERQQLSKLDKEYSRSKFMVMSREDSTFGGTLI